MIIRGLNISTNIRLHPEFVLAPRAYARRHKVNLADDIFEETDFKKNPEREERTERIKSNIHLVRHGAIRLFTERDEGSNWVRSIDINPSMLLYGAKRRVLAAGDLPLSLSILRKQVAPLLADPQNARHIVPGLVQDKEEPLAYWSEVDSEFLFPGVDIRCLHGLSHHLIGPAQGAKPNRIQLGDKKDDCVIRIKKAKREIDGPDGAQDVEGIRVRLILKGRMLTDEFMPFTTTAKVNNTMRVVAFSMADVARVHQAVMARLEGRYLPVPEEWKNVDDGNRVTTAKAMALVSQLTSIPLQEIRAMDEEVRHPSDSTRKRLKKDLPVEAGWLAPVPVATLFDSSAYASQASGGHRARANIDPLIAAAYGET